MTILGSDDAPWFDAVDQVATAAGVIMERYGLDAARAYAWLMDESVRSGLTVPDIIDRVIGEAAP